MTSRATRETKSQLARRLKIHRHALDSMLAKPGAPAPDRKKTYIVAEVAAFIGSQEGGSLATLREARLHEVRLRCKKLERELALANREVVTVAEVAHTFEVFARMTRDAMFLGLTAELPGKLAGLEAGQIRATLRDYGDSVCQRLQDRMTAYIENYEAGKEA